MLLEDGRFRKGSGGWVVMATSNIRSVDDSSTSAQIPATKALRYLVESRRPLADRKGPWDHLAPRPLLLSTVRVTVVQASTTFGTFMTDQLEQETEREELVKKGKKTPDEADQENDEWEEREWGVRWAAFPRNWANAILKFHAVTLVMRVYEHLASKVCDEITLDRLTKDPFKSALRKRDRLATDPAQSSAFDMGRNMFQTCLWANAIAFLADGTVQQVILGYGYYEYYRRRRAYRQQQRSLTRAETAPSSHEDHHDKEAALHMTMSLAFKSTKVLFSRSVALVVASAGGAVGTILYPGWGTLFGTQIGDGLAGGLLD